MPHRSSPAALNTTLRFRRRRHVSLPAKAGSDANRTLVTLAAMDFEAFAGVISALLSKMGYEDVTLVRRKWRGRNSDGGYDLEATRPNSVPGKALHDRMIVQLKRFGPSQSVYQKNVDELAGVCRRVGASAAMLVTTGRLSPVIEPVTRGAGSALRLIDGDSLVRLLSLYGIDPTGPLKAGGVPSPIRHRHGAIASAQPRPDGVGPARMHSASCFAEGGPCLNLLVSVTVSPWPLRPGKEAR